MSNLNTRRIGTSLTLLALSASLFTGSLSSAQAAPKTGAMMSGAMSGHGAMMTATKTLTGSFKQVTHATKGTAKISGRTLTLSNFETGMGPQLHVYLVPTANAGSNASVKAAVLAKKFVDLGALKSIKGTQRYAISAKAKTKGQSVVIWCDKFDVVFGSAALS